MTRFARLAGMLAVALAPGLASGAAQAQVLLQENFAGGLGVFNAIGTVDLVPGSSYGGCSATGGNCVHLAGTTGPGSGIISNVPLFATAGNFYRIDFRNDQNTDAGLFTSTFTVSFGGTSLPFISTLTPISGGVTFSATATGATSLQFLTQTINGCCFGPVVSDITLSAVAVPGPVAGAGLPALLGLGGLMFWRRRREAAAV